MFTLEAMKAKAENNGMVVKLFKHDRNGYRVYHPHALSYTNPEMWPIAFSERIDHLLESGDAGFVYDMDTDGVWHALVFDSRP